MLERSLKAFQAAETIDSSFAPALEHQWMLFHALHDSTAARYALQRQARVDSTGDYYRINELFAESNTGAVISQARVDAFPTNELSGAMALVSASDLAFSLAPNLALADSLLARAKRVGTAEPELERQVDSNTGRPSRAAAIGDERNTVLAMSDDVLAALVWDGDATAGGRGAAGLSRWLREHPSDSLTTDRARALVHEGLWAFNTGDTATVLRARQALATLKPPATTPWRRSISELYDAMLGAHLAVARKSTDALAQLSRLDTMLIDTPGLTSRMRSTLNSLQADLWERVDEPARALAADQRFDRNVEMNHLASARLRRDARLLEQLARPLEAIVALRNYVALRANAERSLQPDLADAKVNLARLEAKVR